MTKAQELYPDYQIDELLDLIGNTEAPMSAAKQQGVSSQYDVVHGAIKPRDRPKYLTNMTVQDVLDWQDRIDPRYGSEAAGKFQIMEDTLRGMTVSRRMLFDKDGQDICALALLEGRGLKDYLHGTMSITKFTLAIAKEWASFPVPFDMTVKRGNREYHLKAGDSYYSGDAMGNQALIGLSEVTKVLKEICVNPKTPDPRVLTLEEKVDILWAEYGKLNS